jgi:hypothetical protein
MSLYSWTIITNIGSGRNTAYTVIKKAAKHFIYNPNGEIPFIFPCFTVRISWGMAQTIHRIEPTAATMDNIMKLL